MEYNFWILYLLGITSAIVCLFTRQKAFFKFCAVVCIFLIISSAVPATSFWSDLNNYENSYNQMTGYSPIKLANDWAYYNLIYLCKLWGFSFMQAKAFALLVSLLCVMYFVFQFTYKEITFVMLFFMLHLIFNYALILRNSIAFSVWLLGIDGIFKPEMKHGKLKYIVFTIIAAQFHSMIYLYIPLVLIAVRWNNIKKYRKVINAILIIGIVGMIYLVRTGNAITLLATYVGDFLGSDKYSRYAVALGRYAWVSVLCIWAVTVGNVIFTGKWLNESACEGVLRQRYTIRQGVLIKEQEIWKIDQCLERMRLFLVASTFFVPLTIFALHLARYLKYISFVNIIYMAMLFENITDKKKKVYIFVSTCIITLLWLYFDIYIYGGYRTDFLQEYIIKGKWFWN